MMDSSKLQHILNCHPLIKTDIIRGENTDLFDISGRKYVDFESGIWCTALGHSHPRINKVMVEQIYKVIHLHYKLTSNIAEASAVNLLELFHFEDGKAVFLNSGSEAVELSIKLARMISPGKKTLTFSNSYLSALSSNSTLRDKERWYEMDFLKCSNCSRTECTGGCILLRHIDFSNVSAFVFEPAICGSVFFAPFKLVSFLEKEVRKNGGIIAANEVTTGMGRTGRYFGYNHYDLEPDIVALGKSLGNGYPISAVVMRDSIACQVEAKDLIYKQSHQNDPLGCSVANEVINVFKEEHIVERSSHIGEFFMNQLLEIQQACCCVKDVRGRGLMLALELSIDNVVDQIAEKILEKGFFIGTVPQSNVLRFSPALTISKHDITNLCTCLKSLLGDL